MGVLKCKPCLCSTSRDSIALNRAPFLTIPGPHRSLRSRWARSIARNRALKQNLFLGPAACVEEVFVGAEEELLLAFVADDDFVEVHAF